LSLRATVSSTPQFGNPELLDDLIFPGSSGTYSNTLGLSINDNGVIVGTANLQQKATDDDGGPLVEASQHGVMLVPVEIMRVWNDQLPGVEANYLADANYNGLSSIGTGLDNKNYIFIGAAQSNKFDRKGHIKAQMASSNTGANSETMTDSISNRILWRLAKSDDTGILTVASGSSSYAHYDASSQVISVTIDQPDDDPTTNYILVGGYDKNNDGQLDAGEVSIIPQCLYNGGRIPYQIKLVSSNYYNNALSTLKGSGADIIGSFLPHAKGLLDAFSTGALPSEATSSLATTVDRLEPGLDHPVGILFDASQSSTAWGPPLNNIPLPHAGAGASIIAVFGPATQMASDVANSTAMNNWLQAHLSTPANAATIKDFFETNPSANFGNFSFALSDTLDFNLTTDVDLWFAFGKVTVSVVAEVEVDRGYNVQSISVTGAMNDLYDFNFDGPPSLLTHPAASVQAGYNTLGVGGRVFKSRVNMENTAVQDFQFSFPE
jgi:hypothetical protein